jgi:hypothetical protein
MRSRLAPDPLIAQAVEHAGCDDFGEPAWREGLEYGSPPATFAA